MGRHASIWKRWAAASTSPTSYASARAIEGESDMKTTSVFAASAALLALAACSSVPRNTGTSYECDRGTQLKVDYAGDGAIVRVNGRRPVVPKSTPANRGQIRSEERRGGTEG